MTIVWIRRGFRSVAVDAADVPPGQMHWAHLPTEWHAETRPDAPVPEDEGGGADTPVPEDEGGGADAPVEVPAEAPVPVEP